jgi:hypothetical protein
VTVRFRVLSATSAIAGVLMLVVSFLINPGPPAEATAEQLVLFGRENFATVLAGAWLQAVGPLLIIVFAFALVRLANAVSTLAGMLTLFGGTVLMLVSLVEVGFYIAALVPDPALGAGTLGLVSVDIIHALQHLYFIVAAPSLFIPLGFVLLASDVLPRVFGIVAVALGALFGVVGATTLPALVLPNPVLALAGIQTLWWIAAAIALMRSRQPPHRSGWRDAETIAPLRP